MNTKYACLVDMEAYPVWDRNTKAVICNDQGPSRSRCSTVREGYRRGKRDGVLRETGGHSQIARKTALGEGRGDERWLGGQSTGLVALNERPNLFATASPVLQCADFGTVVE